MDDAADFQDAFLEDAVRRGIGHHHCAQRVFVLLRFGPQVANIDIARLVAVHHDYLKPAIAALAGSVPCAELGMRQVVRWPSPRSR